MDDRHGDESQMRAALALAGLGPRADPNPRVGAVVRDAAGRVVGRGFHRGAGTPHAEVVALAQAGNAARDGTAFVTLEPCDHTGRTGPCSRALSAAGVRRVVYAQSDPNPQAAGGAQTLRAAGVSVQSGVLAAEAEKLNSDWSFAVSTGRPRVVWKFAGTLDGRSAAADGTSQWITGPQARADVHRLRARAGAILVGTGTVEADDPWLTVRNAEGRLADRQPLRVVMGQRPVPATARVLDDAAETWQARTRDPHQVLQDLHQRGIRQVWLEGGPTVAAAFLAAGLVDEVIAYLAPVLLGAGTAAVGDLGISTLREAPRLRVLEATMIGPDLRVRATPDASGRES
ncbi:MAG: Diaminohydroxyphosphoribosylaminopyrimidine deaminase / 5-amino-6-(5-phosphoribosylamino)uracil reductase [uncultured Friedmanniella sp.]|uniref:Riboflavin biosynthesis protein RibD n=1 Tax=uncultured Friedmanniella sp. TaxID=335381 RepID=A0A6J4JVA3_9ACTN|nr:MAG: Diaminohydroxyphosphoribosylaminopyrimidine deaminase / 5-amino-6-(5-phosphoribosylamino)uracil reductase [uncultured Friedmanniella sp.]